MNIWQELRRRRVFRVAGLYIVGAWLVIQVADIFFPAWGLPETALRYLFVAAAAGFPVALIFGWFYDIAPQGILRTGPAEHADVIDLSLKRSDYVILMALITIGIAIVLGSLGRIQEEIESGPAAAGIERRDNSFSNLDVNPDTGYFSDGVTEEILHRLSTLGSLHVLASTSSFAFRDSDLSPADISGRLGVRYLLQGSVRRDADHVRVTARLLDETGFLLWSDSFDRKLEGIFTIQTEIASTVSGHIVNEIVPMQELPAGRTTENMEAYNEYLLGRAYFDARTPGWRDKATAAFRRGIELDPGFAPPYAGLAAASTVNRSIVVGKHWEEGRALAEQAVALDPDFAFGHAALGLIQFALERRRLFDEHEADSQSLLDVHLAGLKSLRRAIELDPSLSIAYAWLSDRLRGMGRRDEADAVRNRGIEIDPLNPDLVLTTAFDEMLSGNFERGEALLLRLAQLPEPPAAVFGALYALSSHAGRFEDAFDALRESIRLNRGAHPHLFELASMYAQVGMFDEADYWYEQHRSRLPQEDKYFADIHEGFDDLAYLYAYSRVRGAQSAVAAKLGQIEAILDSPGSSKEDVKLLANEHPELLSLAHIEFLALAHIHVGNYAKGVENMERFRILVQQWYSFENPVTSAEYVALKFSGQKLRVYASVAESLNGLAFAYQQVGREDDASRALQALGKIYAPDYELYEPFADLFPRLLEGKALQRALSGDTAGALEALQQAVDRGWFGYYRVLNDPAWTTTIARPEFQAVLAEAKAELDRRRAVIEAAYAEHDFRAEVEAMLAR